MPSWSRLPSLSLSKHVYHLVKRYSLDNGLFTRDLLAVCVLTATPRWALIAPARSRFQRHIEMHSSCSGMISYFAKRLTGLYYATHSPRCQDPSADFFAARLHAQHEDRRKSKLLFSWRLHISPSKYLSEPWHSVSLSRMGFFAWLPSALALRLRSGHSLRAKAE